jgi:hypothetical protein
MAKMDFKRLAKIAAGRPAVLTISILTGNGSAAIALPGSKARDGLVSVIHAAAGSAEVDITASASIAAYGSLLPGVDVGTDTLTVTWYKFSRP